MRRVMVVGQPGSGKSTFALALGRRLGLPVVHMDRLHWAPGWVERPVEERLGLARDAAARDAWIIEGNYFAAGPERLARADLLVWLDRPVGLRLGRVLRRALRDLGRTRPDMAEGCPERLRNLPGFAAYIWRTRRTRRTGRAAIASLAAGARCRVVRLASDEDLAGFLKEGWGEPPGPAHGAGRSSGKPSTGRLPDPHRPPDPPATISGPGGGQAPSRS